MRIHYLVLVKLKICVFVKILMLEKRNSTDLTYLRSLLLDFIEINISEHKLIVLLVCRHYPGEVGNVYITLRQILLGKCVPNFIRSASFCRRCDKTFWCFFSVQPFTCKTRMQSFIK